MEVITMDSAVWKDLTAKLERIEQYVAEHSRENANLDEMYVDSADVCRFLQISTRTLQRLRSQRIISFSLIGGRTYYTIAEIKRVLQARLVRSSDEHLGDLIAHHRSHYLKK